MMHHRAESGMLSQVIDDSAASPTSLKSRVTVFKVEESDLYISILEPIIAGI